MPKCTDAKIEFGRFGRRLIEADFSGGDLSSDGGLLLLRQIDQHLGLSRAAAAVIPDPRDPARIEHSLRDLLAQRLYGLCCGYEDLNDHKTLRDDVLMQTAVGRDEPLASAPTFSRLENRATRAQAWALHGVLIDQFIASHKTAPEELVLDIDASDVPLHGNQEQSQFHAYYDHHCYLPLYVFCGQAMLACVLRPSKIDGAKNAAAVIKLLITRLRQVWPDTRFIVRGDSGFCRRRLLLWCERSGVNYLVGLARNAKLQARVELAEAALADAYKTHKTKQRLIDEFNYAAKSWPHERRVITRLEHGEQGNNPRFVVTNLTGPAQQLYELLYCQRGEAENRIKEAQLDLFGTRASCSRFIANQFRLLLAALAYTLMHRLRALALQATQLERASAATIRVRLLKIGAAILRNTRRVRVMLATHHPLRELFADAAAKLAKLGAGP
jgi:Transposase DDE domain group 1